MNANDSTNEPIEGGGNEPTVVERGGPRRSMNEGEKNAWASAMRARMAPADAEALNRVRELDDAARAKEDAARQAGARSWEDLENSTADDQQQTAAPISVPDETPDQHREMVAGFVEQIAPLAQKLNLPAGEVQDVVDFAVSLAVTDRSNVSLEDRDACMVVLNNRYGVEETSKIVKDAQAAVERLGPKMAEFLNSTMLGNDPSVLYALAAHKRGDLKLSPAKAQAELDTMARDPKSAYRNANAPGHKSAVVRANMLYRIVSKADAKKAPESSKPKAPAMSSAKKTQEAELKSLLAHPAYRDRGHRESGSVRARIEALYSTLYPDKSEA